MKVLLVPFAVSLTFLAVGVPTVGADTPREKEVAGLIERLGSDSYAEREEAAKQLEAIGADALEPLKAAIKHGDAEIKGRAARLVSLLEEQAITSAMLAPAKVHLAVKNVSVLEVVSELSRKSGFPLDIAGNRVGAAERKITLDTGDATFWQALEQVCQKAGLAEVNVTPPPIAQPVYQQQRKGGGFQQVYIPQPLAPARTNIILTDGEVKQVPVSHQGSVRIQALPGTSKVGAGEMQLMLDVNAEHRLQEFGVVGAPLLSKIVDDSGRLLSVLEPEAASDPYNINQMRFAGNGNGNGNAIAIVNGNVVQLGAAPFNNMVQRTVLVRIKLSEKGAKSLKEVSGKLTVQALNAPEILVRVKNVLGSVGQSFVGRDGHAIHVQAIDKQADGSYRIRLALENPGLQDPFGPRNIRGRGFNGNFNGGLGAPPNSQASMPKMVDADGKECAGAIINQGINLNGTGQVVYNAILDYRPSAEPAQLVLQGQRLVLFSVPFTFTNVPVQ